MSHLQLYLDGVLHVDVAGHGLVGLVVAAAGDEPRGRGGRCGAGDVCDRLCLLFVRPCVGLHEQGVSLRPQYAWPSSLAADVMSAVHGLVQRSLIIQEA